MDFKAEWAQALEEIAKPYTNASGNVDFARLAESEEFKSAMQVLIKDWARNFNTIRAKKIEGFVALYDILGFQSLVENNNLDTVMLTYQQMMECHNIVEYVEIIKVINYSDTFLIYTTEVSDRAFKLLLLMSNLLFVAANAHEMPIRGATAVGELYVSDAVAIGRPIVEAYKSEKKQNWMGCWITHECVDRISKETIEELLGERTIVRYPIPLKEGDVRELYALNWLSLLMKGTDSMLRAIREPLKNTGFLKQKPGHGWAEERKHGHTRQFIDFIYSLLPDVSKPPIQ